MGRDPFIDRMSFYHHFSKPLYHSLNDRYPCFILAPSLVRVLPEVVTEDLLVPHMATG